MDFSDDPSYFPQTLPSSPIPCQPRRPPPLPPQSINSSASSLLEPPFLHDGAKISYHSHSLDQSWFLRDPRSASTQSLVPAEKSKGKRTLLLIYIHGFLGNETSFRSFPAHVHNLVSSTLASTHYVHTKIYPRYKSRRAIEHARDEFSNWLRPNESAQTDVILLGHSMGGILSAEVALLPSSASSTFMSSAQQLRHQILGTINFDCPFLGMHPGVVISGIGSLFRSAPTTPEMENPYSASGYLPSPVNSNNNRRASSPSLNPLPWSHSDHELDPSHGTSLNVSDPNYNPPFPNDIYLPERTGWDSAVHFLTKHSHDLTKATSAYVTSHLEFGGCLADYRGLKNRYTKLRALESGKSVSVHECSTRIRFLNYYTACTGRPKKEKSARAGGYGPRHRVADTAKPSKQFRDLSNLSLASLPNQSPIPSPRISVEEYRDGEVHHKHNEDLDGLQSPPVENPAGERGSVTSIDDSVEHARDSNGSVLGAHKRSDLASASSDESHSLPPLPPFPERPQPYDPATYPDRITRNLAHKKYSAEFKSHLQALKAYDKAINQRLKLMEKQEKNPQPVNKLVKLPRKPESPFESPDDSGHDVVSPNAKPADRRFCILPPRINGQMDPCWVRVVMKGVDEVGGHCGLFAPGDHYGWLVNDVSARIKEWVEEM